MTTPDMSDGDVVLITTPHPISPDQHTHLQQYVDRQIAAGKPIILEAGFDLQFRRPQPSAALKNALARVTIRTGDHVFHRPSGETHVVAYADYVSGTISACGWPDGETQIKDCSLTYAAAEHEYRALLARLSERRGDRARAIAFRDERP